MLFECYPGMLAGSCQCLSFHLRLHSLANTTDVSISHLFGKNTNTVKNKEQLVMLATFGCFPGKSSFLFLNSEDEYLLELGATVSEGHVQPQT